MTALELLARFWKPLIALVAVACITMSVRGYGERQYDAGVAAQRAADDKASSELRARVDKLTAENQRMAAQAHETYEAEHAHTLLSAHLPVGTRELCKPADAHAGGADVPAAGAAHPGDAAEPATAGMGSAVSAPDSGQPVDRRRLLAAFAALFDDDTGVIREFQAREAPRSLFP